MAAAKMVNVSGSKKVPVQGAKAVAPAPPDERFEVTLRLRPKKQLPKRADLLKLSTKPIPQLTQEQFENLYGADSKDIAKIRTFADANGLAVVRESPARRTVILSGTVANFNKAFGVNLKTYAYADGTYRGRTGFVKVPSAVASIVEGVFGLDNRPVARRHRSAAPRAAAGVDGARPFSAVEVARLYSFPTGVDGSGQTIGIIELGGGYRPEDLDSYFGSLNLPTPTVIPVSVDGGSNSPSTADSDDSEVVLDIEVAGAVAPGAKIVVYFAPNDAASNGFLDALTKAVHDTDNQPSVISISWGGPEQITTSGFQQQFDQTLQAAALLGITVCVASGDNGAADIGPRVWDGLAHVDFPSSSAFALACGGTRLIAAGSSISAESVWNQGQADLSQGQDGSFGSGGGGISDVFPLPGYQQQAGVPTSVNPGGRIGRGVPDVTGAGDPDTGYNIVVDNQKFPEGGTSAVAPLWAGLIALINQKLNGRVGFINPQLYALPAGSGALRNVSNGDNRVSFQQFASVGYDAGPGWSACAGLGSPDGTILSNLLSVSSPVGGIAAPQPRQSRKRARRVRN
jgi:kumamolisin